MDLSSEERRSIIDGEEPFEEDRPGMLRIGLGGQIAEQTAEGLGLRLDSWLGLLWPSSDVDSDATAEVVIRFLLGSSTMVLIDSREALPRRTLDAILGAVERAVRDIDAADGAHPEVALMIREAGRWVLERRIQEVEGSVRGALDDAEFTPADDRALREYPQRLARVEMLAGRIRDGRREWGSARPKGPLDLATIDFFDKDMQAVAQNARDGVARLSALISSQQIVLTQRRAQETSRFQRVVTIVGATVLVPGLVAAVFGADVGFHGRDTSGAFWAMLLLMAGSAVVTYALVRSFEAGSWRRLRESRPARAVARISPTARMLGLGAIGALLLGLGVLVLADGPASPPASKPEVGAPTDSPSQAQTTPSKKVDKSASTPGDVRAAHPGSH